MNQTTLSIIIIATVITLGVIPVIQNQVLLIEEPGMQFIDTKTILLKGELASTDFILLMDLTGFAYDSGNIAMKVPCESFDEELFKVITLVPPAEGPFDSSDAVIVNMDIVPKLSAPILNSCVYHGDMRVGMTSIILRNASDDTISFGSNAGYTVTITIVGEA